MDISMIENVQKEERAEEEEEGKKTDFRPIKENYSGNQYKKKL